jgi:hypothetical protein
VAEKLAHLRDDLWAATSLLMVNRQVVFVHPDTGRPEEVVSGQHVLALPLRRIMADTRDEIRRIGSVDTTRRYTWRKTPYPTNAARR